MRAVPLVGTAIAATLASGCCTSSVCNCEVPPAEPFELDAEVTQSQLDEIVAAYGYASGDEIDCEALCREVYRTETGREAGEVAECETEVDDAAPDTGDPVVGTVACRGTEVQLLCEGRRPLGFEGPPPPDAELGETLAHFAMLEAASVIAFGQLASQLDAWGAPAALVDRCRQAQADEVLHAAAMAGLARRMGRRVPRARVVPCSETRLEVALHNAVEGCVSETWSALVAHVIARSAGDARVRAAFARIASDETRHAQLAWDLHAWLVEGLTPEEAARVDAARTAALGQLPAVAEAQARLHPPALGLSDATAMQAAAGDFARRLAA